MWMYGRFRADSPQGVGCVTSARFHHPTTLANTLIRIRALPDPLRGIGSVSLALTTRILENWRAVGTLCDYVSASNTCNFQGVVQEQQNSTTSKLAIMRARIPNLREVVVAALSVPTSQSLFGHGLRRLNCWKCNRAPRTITRKLSVFYLQSTCRLNYNCAVKSSPSHFEESLCPGYVEVLRSSNSWW